MNTLDTLCLTAYFGLIKLYGKLKVGLMYLLWPLSKHVTVWELARHGIHVVKKSSPLSSPLDYIIPEDKEKDVLCTIAENPMEKALDYVVDGVVQVGDKRQFVFSLLRPKNSIAFKTAMLWDPITWPLSRFNMQSDKKAWDVCTHYDLGKCTFFFIEIHIFWNSTF